MFSVLADESLQNDSEGEADLDPDAILANLAKEAALKRKSEAPAKNSKKKKIPKLGQTIAMPNFNVADSEEDSEDNSSSRGNDNTKALLLRIQQLEQNAVMTGMGEQNFYKQKYEELLQAGSSSAVSSVVPREPPPLASLVTGVWQEKGKDPVQIRDDGHKTLQAMGLRLALKPPNLPSKDWWDDISLGISTTVTTPIRGSSLVMTDITGHRGLNEAVVKQLHDR